MKQRRIACLILLAAATAGTARAQIFGLGGSVGLVNDVDERVTLNGFKHSEVAGWLDYLFERTALLRATFGSMRTKQARADQVVTTPEGDLALPGFKERINYTTLGVSYLWSEGFYTSGLFAGVGGYHIKPDAVAPELEPYRDLSETVFGFHAGLDGDFRLFKNLSVIARFTYHNVSAHPHRQFVNANAGLLARF